MTEGFSLEVPYYMMSEPLHYHCSTSVAMTDLLPLWTYQSDQFLELEKEHLFKRNWMLAGHISDLPKPGSAVTFDGFGERAIIVKGLDNKIRAFHNVCRHRGARLLTEGGHCPHYLSCPFHGWTYDLTGDLIAVPSKDSFDSLSLEENGLVPIAVEVWMGFIFIRIAVEGLSLSETLKPVADRIAPYRIEEMQEIPGSAYSELRPYNWKIIHDIDNEGYHVPVGHPSLQELYGKSYRDWNIAGIPVSSATLNDRPGKNWSVKHYQKLLPDYPHLPEANQRLWFYIGIFPNTVIGLYPDSVEYYMTIPNTINATIYSGRSFHLPDRRRRANVAQYLNRRINTLTSEEDEKFVLWMQEGMTSSAFPKQQLSSKEQGVRDFHHQIQHRIPVATLEECPATDIHAVNEQMLSK